MKKSYLVMAAAAALFAACSSDDLGQVQQAPPATADDGAVMFDAYVNRGLTRAGVSGGLTTSTATAPEINLEDNSFGVFAYYTDGEMYAGNTKPNFMYNQEVEHTSGSWQYAPVKYWPNEFGSDAISDQVDRVSFFSYAPWVQVNAVTGVVTDPDNTKNITGMTRNNATGDPFIKYTATMDANNTVDLCYGVAANNFISSNSMSFPNDIKKGEPFINMTKPGAERIKFDFKHALAKLNVQVDAMVNSVDGPSGTLDDKTKIWVRSVKFEGITLKGQLNLRDGKWYAIDASGDNEITSGSVTVHDGLKDGKEPIGTASNETPASLNPAIIQSLPYDKEDLSTVLQTTDETNVKGVTTTAQNLFNPSSTSGTNLTDPVFVIPTGEPLKVTIVYDVETYDPNLAYYLSDGVTLGSTIQNSITKTVNVFGGMKAGYFYTLNLHLGMRSVEFDAEVHGWDATPTASEDLPYNANSIAATASPFAEGNGIIADNVTTYEFKVTGLTANEVITVDKENEALKITTASPQADANGNAVLTATWSGVNSTTSNKKYYVTAEGSTTHKGVKIFVTQKAHSLDLAYASHTANTIVVAALTGVNLGDTGTVISVIDLEDDTDKFVSATGLTITTSALTVGHTYKVTVKHGDVTESFTKQIASIP